VTFGSVGRSSKAEKPCISRGSPGRGSLNVPFFRTFGWLSRRSVPATRALLLSKAANKGASLTAVPKHKTGTTVSYRDNEAATTTFVVLKPAVGHRQGNKCVAGRPHKAQQRCTRYVPLGSFTHHDSAGKNKLHFTGRVHGHKLKPGRYILSLTPKANGKTGRTVKLAFRIIR
jgi:hypothetical protein